MLKAPRLSRKTQRRQFDPLRRQASADIYGGSESATHATQIQAEMLKVPRVSRKRQRRQFDPLRRQASVDIYGGSESATPAAWHTNPGGDAESATPVTQKAAASI